MWGKLKKEIKEILKIEKTSDSIKEEFLAIVILTLTMIVILNLKNRLFIDQVNEKSKNSRDITDEIMCGSVLVFNIISSVKFVILHLKKKAVYFINYRVEIILKLFAIFCAGMALLIAI